MLTAKQPPVYGYKPVHDLPTPPSASRTSPPLGYQESSYRQPPSLRRSQSPANQPMSAPHRGLPPPAAMTLPPQQQQQPPSGVGNPHSHPHHPHQPPHQPHPPPQNHPAGAQSWPSLPAPPSQWQGAEESMKNWLQTRAEEEKTKQEEEKTRQESLRLEQRRIEADMLRASLGGGIPPPMVPLVFAGMGSGGVLPQASLEWAQQFMPPSQSQHLQLMAPQGAVSPQHQRDQASQGQVHYGVPATQGAGQAPGAYTPHPGSPSRTRAQSTTGSMGHPMAQGTNPQSLNMNMSAGSGGTLVTHQTHSQLSNQSAQQDSSPSIYFHHWQPPTSQAGASSNRPGTPSGDAPKKRKTAGEQRSRSPPPLSSSSTSNQPASGRKGHKRQRSDVSWYQSSSAAQDRAEESDRSAREKSPGQASTERSRTEVGKHSVSSLLSADPAEQAPGAQQTPNENRSQSWQAGPSAQYRGGGESWGAKPSSPRNSEPPPQVGGSQRG